MSASRDTLVVGAAPEPGADAFYRDLLGSFERVIAADGAGEWCVRLGRVPEVVVGDFDSAEPGAPERLASMGCRIAAHPADKDLSDLDLCVEEARSLGACGVAFAAAFTGRLDHTFVALGTVLRAADLSAIVREPGFTAWTVGGAGRPSLRLDLPVGMTFSILCAEPTTGVTVEGGRYPLMEGSLDSLDGLGLSNVAKGVVRVRSDGGRVLVIADGCLDPHGVEGADR